MSRALPLALLLAALPAFAADKADLPPPPPLGPSAIPLASAPQTALPASTELTLPQAPPAPPAPPYFAQTLTRLGTPAALALKLAAYQETRHPGAQGQIYHGLQHSRDVPDLTALSLEGLPAGELTERQKALLIVAAAFHDIDPERPADTPASVSRTTAYLASDPQSRELLAELSARWGFTPAQVSALIDATNFNPNPELQKKLDEEFRERAKTAFGNDADWALKWGPRLSFFDKAATYVGGPKSAERQVKGLAHELREITRVMSGKAGGPTDEQMIQGTPAFLQTLRDSPDFALLPARLQSNFANVSKHFDLKAKGLPSPWDAEDAPSRGPPASLLAGGERALALARSGQDEGSAVDATRTALEQFRRQGFMFLPAGSVFTPDAARALVTAADQNWPTDKVFRTWEFFDGRDWRVNNRQTPALVAMVQAAMGRLQALLDKVTPGEGLVLIGVEMRLGSDHPTGIHVDGSYITATLTLRGPGTLVFDESVKPARILRAKPGEAAVITNRDREYLAGVDGTIHSSPPATDPKRVVFVIRYRAARTGEMPTAGRGTPEAKERYARQEAREKARIRAVADALKEKPASEAAQKAGLKGIWQKLFE